MDRETFPSCTGVFYLAVSRPSLFRSLSCSTDTARSCAIPARTPVTSKAVDHNGRSLVVRLPLGSPRSAFAASRLQDTHTHYASQHLESHAAISLLNKTQSSAPALVASMLNCSSSDSQTSLLPILCGSRLPSLVRCGPRSRLLRSTHLTPWRFP